MSNPSPSVGLDDAMAAFDNQDYNESLSLYTQLISSDPTNSSYYLHRSNTHLKLQNYSSAISDVNRSLELGSTSHYAYLRKGIGLFYLDLYEEAIKELKLAEKLGNKTTQLWIRKCEAELERTKPTSTTTVQPIATSMSAVVDAATATASSTSPPLPLKTLAERVPPSQHVLTRSLVTLTEYTKNVKRESIEFKLGEDCQSYSVKVKMGDESVYVHELKLYAPVQADTVQLNLNPYKLEVVMKKKIEEDWPGLELSSASRVPAGVVKRENVIREDAKVSYPTSAAKKVDWSGVEKEVKKAEEEEKPEGEAALHKLFQTIYKDANEDTRRAMIKSFQTSGGTVLSTNWKEVGTTDYTKDRQAPKGQEFRDWNSQ